MKRYPMLWILTISVALRVAAAIYLGNQVVELPGTADQVSYHNLALRIVAGYGFTFGQAWWPATPAGAPTAHWSYLYSLFLAAIYWVAGPNPLVARLIQAIAVGLLHPWLVFKIGAEVFDKTTGYIAALLTAVYIYFVYYAGALMTEPFYITAILASFYLAIRIANTEASGAYASWRRAAGLGLLLGIAVLLRQLFLIFVPFLLAWLAWARFRRSCRVRPENIAAPLLAIVLMISPFTFYNASRFGRFVLLNTNSGFAFYWGNHPYYGSRFIPILPEDEYRRLLPQDQLHLDEAALDSELLKRGVQFVLDDPARYFILSLSRIPPYFEFWPSRESGLVSNVSRVFSFGVSLPFMLMGLVLVFRRRKRNLADNLATPAFLLFLFAIVYSGIHILTWTLVRYRLPIDALMLTYAGYALVFLYERWSLRQASAHAFPQAAKK